MHRGNAVTYTERAHNFSILSIHVDSPALIGNWWVGNNATLSCKFRLTLRTLTYSFQPCATTQPIIRLPSTWNFIQRDSIPIQPIPSLHPKRQILVMNKYSWTSKLDAFNNESLPVFLHREIKNISRNRRIFPSFANRWKNISPYLSSVYRENNRRERERGIKTPERSNEKFVTLCLVYSAQWPLTRWPLFIDLSKSIEFSSLNAILTIVRTHRFVRSSRSQQDEDAFMLCSAKKHCPAFEFSILGSQTAIPLRGDSRDAWFSLGTE